MGGGLGGMRECRRGGGVGAGRGGRRAMGGDGGWGKWRRAAVKEHVEGDIDRLLADESGRWLSPQGSDEILREDAKKKATSEPRIYTGVVVGGGGHLQ